MEQNKVVALVQKYTELTPQEIEDFIDADWHEGAEHTDWIESASDEEIADWVIAGNPDQRRPGTRSQGGTKWNSQ